MVVVTNWTDKWCPHARLGSQSENRHADGQPLSGSLCMGGTCMAWRWDDEIKRVGYCGAFGPVAPFIQRKPFLGDEND